MNEPSLFPELDDLVPVLPAPTEPAEKLSADRRRTLRQHAAIDAGRHPLTGQRLADNGETCGTCANRVLVHWHNRTYAKCAQGIDPKTTPLDSAPFASHGAGTDCRAWWPACPAWEAKP